MYEVGRPRLLKKESKAMILPSETLANARGKSHAGAMKWLIAALGITVTLLVSVAHTTPAQAGAARYAVNTPSCDPAWVVQSPISPTYGLLRGLAVVSPNDIWATGRSQDSTLTEHWDGNSWGVQQIKARASTGKLRPHLTHSTWHSHVNSNCSPFSHLTTALASEASKAGRVHKPCTVLRTSASRL